jgi:ceramide glucosyltransferase
MNRPTPRVFWLLLFAERLLKQFAVWHFFRRPRPAQREPVRLVSIMQPILSGDPELPGCLERNLRSTSIYPREWLWLVDSDDHEGLSICQELLERYPHAPVRLVPQPPPAPNQNPKLVKLIAGAALAGGDVLCALDDDTVLPNGGLEQCLPYLDQPGAGLAFGLPYYESFGNFWSSLVAYFVDSHSLLTYVPFALVHEPVTINGMFYAIKRTTFEAIGGFEGLEGTLADDFAVAQRIRQAGYTLVQTPLLHPIRTTVRGPRQYASLVQRWFIFPRESLMRHLNWREQTLFYLLTVLPLLFPLLALLGGLLRPLRAGKILAVVYIAYDYSVFAQLNRSYLGSAAPWGRSWLVPLLKLALPFQVLVALASPQRIIWRGHRITVQKGGGLRMQRRTQVRG